MTIVVGFTGTRKGMTEAQKVTVAQLLVELGEISAVHHGDAIGADSTFHEICRERGIPLYLHPAKDARERAYCQGATHTAEPTGFLALNRAVVNCSHVIIATPSGFREQLRSGTWAAIRYARKERRRLYLVWPDGTMTSENGNA